MKRLDKFCEGWRPYLREKLGWRTRVKICIGIARGLAFLHEGAAFKIVHRDIELSNIFLDKDLNAKIADFGLAKLDLEEGTHISTRVAGTIGYMAPEYAMRGYLTVQADVYSFGVVMLELISGRRFSDRSRDDSPHLLDFALALQMKGDLLSLFDENLKTSISVKEACMVLDLGHLANVMKAPILVESDDLTRVDSDEMSMIEYSDNYIDNNIRSEMVTHQGNASTSLENEALVLSKYRDLVSNAKDSTSENGVGVLSSSHISRKQENNICTTVFCGDSISIANDPNIEGGEDAIQVFTSPGASNEEEKTYTSACVNDSISEDRDDSRLLIDINVSTVESLETSISNSKASTSSTFEYVNEAMDEAELKYIEPHFEAGKYYIECSDEELKVGCNKWKNSLVGCFVSESGAFCFDKEVDEDVLRQAIEKATDVSSKGNGYSVSFIGNGHFLLQFSSDEDKIRVRETSGLLHIEGKTLVSRKWDWKLKFVKVEMLKSVIRQP